MKLRTVTLLGSSSHSLTIPPRSNRDRYLSGGKRARNFFLRRLRKTAEIRCQTLLRRNYRDCSAERLRAAGTSGQRPGARFSWLVGCRTDAVLGNLSHAFLFSYKSACSSDSDVMEYT